jgi:hypothetical protein
MILRGGTCLFLFCYAIVVVVGLHWPALRQVRRNMVYEIIQHEEGHMTHTTSAAITPVQRPCKSACVFMKRSGIAWYIIIAMVSVWLNVLCSCGRHGAASGTARPTFSITNHAAPVQYSQNLPSTTLAAGSMIDAVNISNTVAQLACFMNTFSGCVTEDVTSGAALSMMAQTMADDDGFINMLNETLYSNPDCAQALMFVLTNALQHTRSDDKINFYLHTTGVAMERMGRSRDAIQFYQSVIDRAEQGISTKECSDSAYFLATLYKDYLNDYSRAEDYYNKFADFSEKFDNNHNNAVFAKAHLADMLSVTDVNRAEKLCRELLTKNPTTKHRNMVMRTKYFIELRRRYPLESISVLRSKAHKKYPPGR